MRRREHWDVHWGSGVHHFGIAGTAALATGLALHVRPVPPACCVWRKHFVDHKVGEAVAAPAHKHVCAQTSVGQRTPPTCSLGGSPFQQRPRKRVFVCRLVQASLGELTHERADGGADDDVGTDVRAHVTADPSAEQHTNIGADGQSDRALRQYPRQRLRVFKRL